MADIKDSSMVLGLNKIKAITLNKSVPDTVRILLRESLVLAENSKDKVIPRVFWPKLVSQAMYDNIKDSSIEDIAKLTELRQFE